jgi:hypothetical protein
MVTRFSETSGRLTEAYGRLQKVSLRRVQVCCNSCEAWCLEFF